MKKLFICLVGIFTFCNIGNTHELSEVMSKVLPAVTYIQIKQNTVISRIDNKTGEVTKVNVPTRPIIGSGFMIESNIVITNYHVISSAVKNNSSVEVLFQNDTTRYKATIIGYDKIADIALLKIQGEHPFVEIVDHKNLRMGDPVFSISHFYGIGWSGTQGIISSTNRQDVRYPYIKNLQLQLLQGTGSSGGPVFDMHGHVIGVNRAILSMFPINRKSNPSILSSVAYPIRAGTVLDSIARIKKDMVVARVDLGVQLIGFGIDSDFHKNYSDDNFFTGVFVLSVDKDSLTLLKEVDVIVSIDRRFYSDAGKLLEWLDDKYDPGDTINMQVYRDDKIINITVTLEMVGI